MKSVMLKRLLAVVMAVAMIMTWMVAPVAATGTDGGENVTSQCSCENKCTEGAANAECTVCTADLTACAGTAAPEETPVPQSDGDGSDGTQTAADYVAEINGQGYATLAEAVTAAASGNTIFLSAGTYTLPAIAKDLNFVAAEGVAAKDIILDLGTTSHSGSSVSVNVSFNGVTLKRPTTASYVGFHHSTSETYTNCIIEGQYWTYAPTATFTGCTFNTTDAGNYNIWTYGSRNVAFTNCTFNSAGKSVLVYNEGACGTAVTVINCTFIASAPVEGKAAIEMDSQYLNAAENEKHSIVIDSASTATGFGTGSVSGNSLWNNKKGNLAEVTVGGEKVLSITPTDAASLKLAVESGGTVKLAADITTSETMSIPAGKTVTVDLNGHTYTYTGQNDAFTNEGTLTLTNTQIDGKFVDSTNVVNDREFVYNKAGGTLSIEECAIESTNIAVWNEGTATIWGGITNTTTDAVKDTYKYAVYNKNTMTITSSTIVADYGVVSNISDNTLTITGSDLTGAKKGQDPHTYTVYTGKGNTIIDTHSLSGNAQSIGAGGLAANVTVKGGTFAGGIYTYGNSAQGTTGTVTVTGGTFNATTGAFSVTAGNGWYENPANGKIVITGGTFAADPSEYVALGYEWKEDKTVGKAEELQVETEVAAPKAESEVESSDATVNSAVTDITTSTVNSNTTVTSSIKEAVSDDTVTAVVQSMGITQANTVKITVDIVLTGVSTDNTTVTTLTFDVEPQVQVVNSNDQVVAEKKVENSQLAAPITFRLPIPESVTAKYVNVTHDGAFLGAYEVQGEGSNKYIELTSSTFSPWTVSILTNDTLAAEDTATGVKYATIEEAYANAANGSVIKLLDNVSTAETLTVESGENITVDLNGKTFTYTGTGDAFTNNGTLTLTNSGSEGKFVDSTNVDPNREFVYNVSGTLNITNCAIEATNIAVWNEATTAISGAAITTTTTDAAKNTYKYSVYNRGTMTITDSELTASYGVVSNTSATSSDDASNTLTITNSTLTGAQGGLSPHTYTVYTGKGITNIVSGTFSGNNESVGAGGLEATVTIKDGTFAGGLYAYGNSTEGTSGTINVEGGTFNAQTNAFNEEAGNGWYAAAAEGTIVVSGGTFAVEPPEDVLAENFSPVKNSNGTYGVEKDPIVAKSGDAEFYSIEAAFDAANEEGDSSVITLMADTTLDDTTLFVEEGVSIILDLNGKTLTSTFTQGNALSVEAGGSLVIRDSGSNGALISTTESGLIVNDGTLKVESGKLEAKSFAIYGRGSSVTTISGGTIVSGGYTVDYAGGKLTITGGTITGEPAVFVRAEYFDTVSITGGTFTSTEDDGSAVWCNDDDLVASIISGGEFIGAEAPSENLIIDNHYFTLKSGTENTWILAEYPHHLVGTDKVYANGEQTALEVVMGEATDGTDAMSATMTHSDTFEGEYKISRKLTVDAAGFDIGGEAKITVPADAKNNVEFLNVGKNKLGFILTPGYTADFSDGKVVITPTYNNTWLYNNPVYLTSNGSAEKGWTCYAEAKGAAFTINWKDNTVAVNSGKYEIFDGHVAFQYSKLTAYNVNTGKEITTWYTESGVDVQLIGNGFHSAVKDYYIGNVKAPKDTYTSSGSTILTLKAEYLKTLAVGEYKIVINYLDGGQSEGVLRISNAPDPENPKTGDTIMTTVIIMAASGAALAALVILSKKRKRA